MKNWDNLIVENFKYITIIYMPQVESVKLMIQEHYDTPAYDDTLFLINTGVDLNKEDFPQKRKIYYNLEHGDDMVPEEKFLVNEFFHDFGVTDVWSMEPNCETFDTDLGVTFMPMRYTSYIKKVDYPISYKFDLGFVGIVGPSWVAPRRDRFFGDYLEKKCDFSIKILNGYPISEMQDEFASCKFVLDMHRNYRHNMQNQVRIFEYLCLGYTVLSEKSRYNMFPGLIHEWESIEELDNLIKTIEPCDFSEKYKEMAYSDEAYENYRLGILNSNYYQKTFNYFFYNKINKIELINKLVDKFNFKNYLEIGVAAGDNFRGVVCDNKVGVDPDPNSAATHIMSSDEYFNTLPSDVKFDIVLIDGLHLYEQCYKDITNALNHLSPNGIIICHDMNPLEEMYNTRVYNVPLWNGDVWKSFVKIRNERNDVYTTMIEDCDFGLGVITWGNQEPITLDKPVDRLLYNDFKTNKAYLMNTTTLDKFIEYNRL